MLASWAATGSDQDPTGLSARPAATTLRLHGGRPATGHGKREFSKATQGESRAPHLASLPTGGHRNPLCPEKSPSWRQDKGQRGGTRPAAKLLCLSPSSGKRAGELRAPSGDSRLAVTSERSLHLPAPSLRTAEGSSADGSSGSSSPCVEEEMWKPILQSPVRMGHGIWWQTELLRYPKRSRRPFGASSSSAGDSPGHFLCKEQTTLGEARPSPSPDAAAPTPHVKRAAKHPPRGAGGWSATGSSCYREGTFTSAGG